MVKSKVNLLYNENWKNEIKRKPKLRFYRLFKNEPKTENYLLIHLSPMERSYIAQVRLGILQIAIETGRFKSIPVEKRLFILCNTGKIEDEFHVLFECKVYELIRKVWLHKINLIYDNTVDLSINDKQLYLNHIFQYPRITAKYIVQLMKHRDSVIYS